MPITVWPADPTDPEALAQRLLSTFTRPGQLTIALHPHPGLVIAAGLGGHRLAAVSTRRRDTELLTQLADRHAAGPRRARLRVEHTVHRYLSAALRAAAGKAHLLVAPAAVRVEHLRPAADTLQPGGHLVLTTDEHSTGPWAVSAEQRAVLREAGLIYLQHIVAVHATVVDGAWQPAGDPDEPDGGEHGRIHHDLYVFGRPGAGSRR
ncbi:MAG TPA: hypothetical protein VGN37_23700 [Actinocatenispora sp.]